MAPRISKNTTISLEGTSITVAELLALLNDAPADAVVSVAVHAGDYGYSGYATLTITS